MAGINIQLADILDYSVLLTDVGGVSVYGAVNLSSSSIQTPFMQFSIDKILFFSFMISTEKWVEFQYQKCETIQGGEEQQQLRRIKKKFLLKAYSIFIIQSVESVLANEG